MVNNAIGQQAAALYQNTAKIATAATSNAREDEVSFGTLFKAGMEKIVDTQEKSEKVSADAVIGKASPVDVVQAVTEAEVVLQTAKAITSRVISAYQDILRMPI
tara:strand:- start:151 stop:462 length:312 start_codon:yes stop_codon:yes gene_type:complete